MTSTPVSMKPQFFISRPNGTAIPTLVPLIPVDELPSTVIIEGVTRSLAHADTVGMQHVGLVEPRHLTFVVKDTNTVPKSLAETHGRTLSDSKWARGAEMRAEQEQSPVRLAMGIDEQPPSVQPQPVTGDNLAIPLPSWHDQTKVQTVAKKEYCTHWVSRGCCDFAQTGCRFKHEMPLDLPTLKKVGHRDIPEWYRQQHGLRSLLAADTPPNITSRVGSDNFRAPHLRSGNWRSNEVLVPTDEDTGTDTQIREWTTTRLGRHIQPRPGPVRHNTTRMPKQQAKKIETLAEKLNNDVFRQLEADKAALAKLARTHKPMQPQALDSSEESRVATPSNDTTGSSIISTEEDTAVTVGGRLHSADSTGGGRGNKRKAGRGAYSKGGRGGRGGRDMVGRGM